LDSLLKLGTAVEKLEPLFLMVMQSCEDCLHQFTPEEKHAVCVRLLSRFTKDDESHCKQIMKLMGDRVKRSTVWRRNKKAIFAGLRSAFLGLVALV
jgi:hypothetical protein